MNKTKIQTTFILIVTVGLIVVVGYFSYLLSSKGEKSVTQVKKTKASAQTYHKLLALNITPVQKDNTAKDVSGDEEEDESPAPTEAVLTNSVLSPVPTLLSLATTPLPSVTKAPTPTPVQPTQEPTPEDTTEKEVEPETVIPTKAPSPTTPLLAYRTISPTLMPVRDTGTGEIHKSTPTPTKKVFSNDTLPESGWGIQQSIVLFIVAATTVFLSFLF